MGSLWSCAGPKPQSLEQVKGFWPHLSASGPFTPPGAEGGTGNHCSASEMPLAAPW